MLFKQEMSEKELQASVEHAALLHGWLYYHTHDSRRSERGFPDLVLVRDGVIIFAELKVKKRKPSWDQLKWITSLSEVKGSWVRVFIWTEKEWHDDTILKALK